MPEFSDLERLVKNLFPINSHFNWKGYNFKTVICDKPTCSAGEPKTDIFLQLVDIDTNNYYTFKISIKKNNADFLENKTSADRAAQIFGADWKNIIINSTLQLENAFYSRPLIYKNSFKRTSPGSITLGWKFEILNKQGGELSAPIMMNTEQKIGIFSGNNLDISKRNAYVNGTIIADSGVANCLLADIDLYNISTPQDVLNRLVHIQNYIDYYNPQLYFACKALNYRTFERKYDGDRPLAVYVDWTVVNDKLTPMLQFNAPLTTRGNAVYNNLMYCLRYLGIHTTDDITPDNVASYSFVV